MKANIKIWTLLLAGIIMASSCDRTEPETPPLEPPVEEPDEPDNPDLPDIPETPWEPAEGIHRIKINNDIMATVGTDDWNAIAYGNGKYVAVSEYGEVAFSSDGEKWESKFLGYKMYCVTYGNGLFVGLGDGEAFYSADGKTWSRGSISKPSSSNYYYAVIYDGKRFVASNSELVYGDGKYVGTPKTIATSTDGKTFTAKNVEASYISYSTDLNSWKKGSFTGKSLSQSTLVYGNGMFVLAGASGGAGLPNPAICYSSDGITWDYKEFDDPSSSSDFTYFKLASYGSGHFVVTDNYGKIWLSSDGMNFEKTDFGVDRDSNAILVVE